MKINIFKSIKENEIVSDERIAKEQIKVETLMFTILKVVFTIIVILELFQYNDKKITSAIIYYAFYFIIWLQPLIYSIRGLWDDVREAIVLISAGCIISVAAILKILKNILVLDDLPSIIAIFAIGIVFAIGSYLIYTITYYHNIRKQDSE